MKRITFSPNSELFAGNRVISPLLGMYARVLVGDDSPNRPGERIHCLLGAPVTQWSSTLMITEVDPVTEDLIEIGQPFQITAESIHIY
jgi:hypothetical protein